jgi:hypothetical protein
MSQRQIARVTGAGLGTINRDLRVPDGTESVPNGTESDANASPAKREAALREQLKIAQTPAVMPSSRYDTVVIDPPWPMKKIERDVRPNQVEFDYPTMDYEQLRAFRPTFQRIASDNCHVFMWTTQKFLPIILVSHVARHSEQRTRWLPDQGRSRPRHLAPRRCIAAGCTTRSRRFRPCRAAA